MGGSTSEDEEKGELHRLESPEKVPPSRKDLASWSFARASDWRGQRIQRVFHGRWTYSTKPGYSCKWHFSVDVS